ncbi:MAG: hypothetical protein AAFW73_09075 [Bacteroidota bacterium]
MKVQSIQFSGLSNGVVGQAIRARKNATEVIPVPEWSADRLNLYDDTAAVYLTQANRNIPVRIRARFSTNLAQFRGRAVEIRALAPPPNPIGPDHLNVLGEVLARPVQFDALGVSVAENFDLINLLLVTRGVGISQVIWHWQYRTAENPLWQTFEVTLHKIYTILDLPRGPWTQSPADPVHWPWTEVLDYAAQWASGAQTTSQAASRVTETVYNLGPELIEYNCVNFLPAYVIPLNIIGDSYFDCTAFLWHLRSGLVNRFVICTDCACIVSTFANVLGANLWQSKMYTQGVNYFRINPILAIGSFLWDLPCGVVGFSYHEVAWSDNCTVNDEVYDACLAIDGDASPTFAPHLPLIPTDLRFGLPGEGLYRDRLAFPTDVLLCNPQPGDRQQRPLYAPTLVNSIPLRQSALPFDDSRCELLKEQLGFTDWCEHNELEESLFVFNHAIPDGSLPAWRAQYESDTKDATERPVVIDKLWRPAGLPQLRAIKMTKYETNSLREAHELLIRLMANAHLAVPYQRVSGLGDVAFAGPRLQTLLFARGNVVMVLSNADRGEVDLVEHARYIDATFYDRKPMQLAPVEGLLVAKGGGESAVQLVERADGRLRIELGAAARLNAQAFRGMVSPEAGARAARVALEPVDWRIFVRDGEVVLEDGELVVSPRVEAQPRVAVYFRRGGQRERVDL